MRTVIITGASDGIGRAAALHLNRVAPDTRLIVVGRNPEKTAAVAEATGATALTADFARLDDVRALADQIRSHTDRIDTLANNAGGLFDGPTLTDDGFETSWQVNVLAPLLLTQLLLPELQASRANVVATSSIAAFLMARFNPDDPETRERFSHGTAYGNAKLADAMMTRELARRVPGINPVSFHPGVIASNFAQESNWFVRPAYAAMRKAGLAKPDSGGRRLAYFAEGTAGVHFERGEFYIAPGKRFPLGPAMRHSARVFDEASTQLGLDWPSIAGS